MTNEMTVNKNTGEIMGEVTLVQSGLKVIEENENYKIVQNLDGSFKKIMKYISYQSFTPETKADKIRLFKAMNDASGEIVTGLKNMIKKTIKIKHAYFTPYEKLNEETGQNEYGVTTMIENEKGEFFATSSKTVYYKLKAIFDAFGYPHEEDYDMSTSNVKVVGTQKQNGVQIDLEFLG